MASVTANRITIEYEEQGSGEPLLMLMGLGAQLIDWPQPFVDMVSANGFRVIRMDNRDIGLSTKTQGPAPTRADLLKAFAHRRYAQSDYLLADMAGDAVALLDHLDIEAAHVVGVSMGGMIAQQLTIDHPTRVLSLCSIMSNTGSRLHGTVAPKLLPSMAMTMTTPRSTDPDEAERARLQAEADRARAQASAQSVLRALHAAEDDEADYLDEDELASDWNADYYAATVAAVQDILARYFYPH